MTATASFKKNATIILETPPPPCLGHGDSILDTIMTSTTTSNNNAKEEHGEKRKRKKTGKRKNPKSRFRDLILNSTPENREKRSQYAKKKEVVLRRAECNKKNRILSRIEKKLIENGQVFVRLNQNSMACEPLQIINGHIVIPSAKVYFKINKANELSTHFYNNEIELLSLSNADDTPTPEDVELASLVNRFIEGDTETIKLCEKKKIPPSTQKLELKDIDYDSIREKLTKRFKKNHNNSDADGKYMLDNIIVQCDPETDDEDCCDEENNSLEEGEIK